MCTPRTERRCIHDPVDDLYSSSTFSRERDQDYTSHGPAHSVPPDGRHVVVFSRGSPTATFLPHENYPVTAASRTQHDTRTVPTRGHVIATASTRVRRDQGGRMCGSPGGTGTRAVTCGARPPGYRSQQGRATARSWATRPAYQGNELVVISTRGRQGDTARDRSAAFLALDDSPRGFSAVSRRTATSAIASRAARSPRSRKLRDSLTTGADGPDGIYLEITRRPAHGEAWRVQRDGRSSPCVSRDRAPGTERAAWRVMRSLRRHVTNQFIAPGDPLTTAAHDVNGERKRTDPGSSTTGSHTSRTRRSTVVERHDGKRVATVCLGPEWGELAGGPQIFFPPPPPRTRRTGSRLVLSATSQRHVIDKLADREFK